MTEDEGNERLLQHSAWLQSLARSVVARRDLAHDIAQETLLVACRRGTAGVLDMRAWLATILRRLAVRRIQSERKRAAHESALPPREPGLSPAELVAKASRQREVVDAVLRLDEPYRTTVLQRYLEERSPESIATASGVPIETVRTRLRRGLQQLRDDLDRRHGDARAWAVPLLGITGFEEALAASGTAAATTSVLAAGAGVVTMSMQAKVGIGIAAVCAGGLAFSFWPSLPGEEPGPVVAPGPAPVATAALHPATEEPPAERAAVAAAASDTPPAPAAPPAVVWQATGRVVDEATNQPIAGAEIGFASKSSGRFTGATPAGGTLRSGADGTFTFDFERLTPGYIELVVRHIDHGTTHVPFHELVARAEAAGTRSTAIGDVLLPRGARLAGLVLANDGKAPIPGARIVHYRATFGAAMQFFADAVEIGHSDAAGRFAVPFRVAPGYRREWIAAITAAGIAWRELRPSRRAHENDQWHLVLRPVATLQLRIVDRNGDALPGADAMLLPACEPLSSTFDFGREHLDQQPLPPFLRAKSGADGVVVLTPPIGDNGMQYGERVPGGRSHLWVMLAGHRQWRQQLDLEAGERREITVQLSAGTRAVVSGVVREEDGAPIAQAEVRLREMRAHTDTAGAFRFEDVDVTEGVIAMQASAPGFVAGGKQIPCQGEATTFAIEINLAPARTLRGVVIDQDGQPVANAFASVGPGVNVMTGADGRFELGGVPMTARQVIVSHGGSGEFATVVRPIPDPIPDELRIEIARKRGGVRVEIAVVDRASGRALEPLAGWLAPILPDGGLAVSRPLQVRDGLCHDDDAPAGRYRLTVLTRDGRRGKREIEVAAGVARVREQLALDPAGTVRCTLDTSAVTKLPERLSVWVSTAEVASLRVVGRDAADTVGDFKVLLSPAKEREVEAIGVLPDTEFTIGVSEETLLGEVQVAVGAGAVATATLTLRDAGKLTIASAKPMAVDILHVCYQLTDGRWSMGEQLLACRGRSELGTVTVPVGAVAWRASGWLDGSLWIRHGKATVGFGTAERVVLD